jgi:hypothetical protein
MVTLWEKIAELTNIYGFGIAFGIVAASLGCWVIIKLVMHLIRSSRAKDVIIGNHLSHLTDQITIHNERLTNFGGNLDKGFDRVVDAIDSGFDRQIDAMKTKNDPNIQR